MPTIFNRLTLCERSWRIYHHDMPQSATLSAIWSELPDHLYSFEDDFMSDAMAGRLPNYSFIEPRYFSDLILHRMPNDQHPPHNVPYGERLIARCYDALRNGAGWEQTLFIVTYDEHGGIYDHVPPPSAVSPDNAHPDGFKFDRYGVRVPTVLISPWIPAGSIIRPPAVSKYPFDHTSILATLRKLFDLGRPLTARDDAAPDLLSALSLKTPSNTGPANQREVAFRPRPAGLRREDNSRIPRQAVQHAPQRRRAWDGDDRGGLATARAPSRRSHPPTKNSLRRIRPSLMMREWEAASAAAGISPHFSQLPRRRRAKVQFLILDQCITRYWLATSKWVPSSSCADA
jgi:Phosphoesterase family